MSQDVDNFAEQVVARSEHIPVLADFWAPWCGPCRVLKPILEKLAAESGGRWELAKVNTEEHPEFAEEYGVRGIPDVRLFVKGSPVAQFTGAMPEPAVRRWLEEHLPTPRRAALGRARELVGTGQAVQALEVLRPLVEDAPGDAELVALAARAAAFCNAREALALVAELPSGSAWDDDVARARTLAESFVRAREVLPASPESSLQQRYRNALLAAQAQDFETALPELVAVLEEDRHFDGGRAKAVTLALFQHLGLRHPLSDRLFRRYSMAVNV